MCKSRIHYLSPIHTHTHTLLWSDICEDDCVSGDNLPVLCLPGLWGNRIVRHSKLGLLLRSLLRVRYAGHIRQPATIQDMWAAVYALIHCSFIDGEVSEGCVMLAGSAAVQTRGLLFHHVPYGIQLHVRLLMLQSWGRRLVDQTCHVLIARLPLQLQPGIWENIKQQF